MKRMGFEETERGPFVSELRESVARQVARGLVSRSGGTWSPECFDEKGRFKINAEDRAKELLAWDWEVEHMHSCLVECLEPPFCRTFNVKTMRAGIRIRWRGLWPWLVTDRLRRLAMSYRVWRDRAVRNPYRTT